MELGPNGRFPDGASPFEGETDEEIMSAMREGRWKGGRAPIRVGPQHFTGSKKGDERLSDFLGGIGALSGLAKEEYEKRKKKTNKENK
jgi:hypothetical protein